MEKILKFKTIAPLNLFISFLFYLVIGILLFISSFKTVEIMRLLILISLFLNGTISILTGVYKLFTDKKDVIPSCISGLGYLLLGFVYVFYPEILSLSLTRVLALWALLNAVIAFIQGALFLSNNIKSDGYGSILNGIVCAVFAYLFWGNGINLFSIEMVLAVYCLYYSATVFADFIREFIRTDYADKKIKPRTRMTVPTLISAFMPRSLLNKINKKLSPSEAQPLAAGLTQTKKADAVPQLEICIHMADGLIEGFGHVDLTFDGIVYSYGTYDLSSAKLGGMICDGSLAVCKDIDAYISHCLKHEKKLLVRFGILLNEEHFNQVHDELEKLFSIIIPWSCKQELAENGKIPMEDFNDPASQLYRAADTQYYKFTQGKFKTYFSLGSNCVRLANDIVGKTGVDILRIFGVITPGTYYSYLNNLFELPNSMVVSRTIYNGSKQN